MASWKQLIGRTRRGKKLSLWDRVKAFFVGIWWKFRGEALHAQLQDHSSPLRTDAQRAVDRVVYETNVPPDCVKGVIFRGLPNMQISHDQFVNGATMTMINGRNYDHAAERAIEWINAQTDLTYRGATSMPRRDRRAFDAIRRHKKKLN